MAIVSLLKPPKEQLFDIIYSENPALREFPLDWYLLGDPVAQFGARTRLAVVGDAGAHNDPRMSGIRNIFYNRVDLAQLLQQQKPLVLYGALTKRSLTSFMAAQWGILLNPELIIDGPVVSTDTTLTLEFQNHQYLILQDSITLHYTWSDLADVGAMFTVDMLPGHDLPWPYPTHLNNTFTVSTLPGYAMPDITMNLTEVTKYWSVTDPDMSAYLATREVGGAYSPNQLTLAVSLASGGAYQWQYVDNENTPYNLWGSDITYNGPSEGDMAILFSHTIRIRTNSTYLHQGTGEIIIHYNS